MQHLEKECLGMPSVDAERSKELKQLHRSMLVEETHGAINNRHGKGAVVKEKERKEKMGKVWTLANLDRCLLPHVKVRRYVSSLPRALR